MATDSPSPHAPKPARIHRFRISINVLIQCIAVALILAMLNYLSFNHYKRWDFTRTHRYALSEKTRHVLAGLKKPVKAIVFFTTAGAISPDVDNLLKEYQYASNGKLEVETVDPVRNPTRATDLEGKYKVGKDENYVILDYNNNERSKLIKAIDMVDFEEQEGQSPRLTAFRGEEAITGGLLQVSDDKPNILYAITGQGERQITDEDYKTVREYIGRENVTVKTLDLENIDAVPKDAGMLLVLGARYDFSEREIKLLKDYWEKKGRMLILLDPNASTPRMDGFLAEQGIKRDDDRILTVVEIVKLLRDVTGVFVQGSPITKNLRNSTPVFLGGTQSLRFDQTKAQAADTRLQVLVRASDGYWGAVNYNIHAGDPIAYFDPNKGDHGQPLAVVVSAEKGVLNDPRVQVDSSRMVAAGNCEFISKESLNKENLDLTINSIDWLLDRVELIGITPKVNSTFTLNLTDAELTDTLSFTALIIPAIVAVFGFGLWWKRRH